MNDIGGYLTSVKGELDLSAEKMDNGGLRVSIRTGKSMPDEDQFYMVKTFIRDNDGQTIANHERIQLPQGAQSQGLNKKIFKDALELYKAEGIDKVLIDANVDVGGYAWFLYGFVPTDASQIDKIADWIEMVAAYLATALQYDAKHIVEFINTNTRNRTKGTDNLTNLMSRGKTPQSDNVIRELFKKISAEFRQTFNNKAKYKEIGKNIGIMNFKEYKISGDIYSISYKALLSIQSLHVDGVRVIPLIKNLFLHWKGELDMSDLDDTYAYLNLKKVKLPT